MTENIPKIYLHKFSTKQTQIGQVIYVESQNFLFRSELRRVCHFLVDLKKM